MNKKELLVVIIEIILYAIGCKLWFDINIICGVLTSIVALSLVLIHIYCILYK